MEDRMTAQQLKNSILQMAVQGKLVPQDPNDEPASVLLDRIRKEKEQLIKDGKIKKNKKESYIFRGADNLHYEQVGKEVKCIEDELPFEIPDSWEWIHINDVSNSYLGKTLNKVKDVGKSVPYLCSINIQNNIIILDKIKTALFSDEEIDKYKLEKNDLLICEGGDVGRAAIWESEEDMYFQNALHRVRFINKISPYFFLYALNYYKNIRVIEKVSKGVTIKHFVQGSLFSLYFPLPPIVEQKRIINKIKELEPLIDKYKQTEEHLYTLNSNIKEKLKKSILQFAIEGKLVPQDSNDEPASVLLDRIRKEKQNLIAEGKIKKDKNESIIYRRDNSYYEKLGKNEICIDELIPFDIPHNWTWTRLSSIANTFGGYAFKSTEYTNTGVRVIRISDFDNNGILDGEYKYYYEEESLNKYLLKENDILLCMTGGTVGKTCVNNRKTKQYLNQRVASIRTYDLIYYRYVYKVITSNYIQCIINKSKTSTNDNISMDTINDFLIPLPPYNEQVRICEAIDKI